MKCCDLYAGKLIHSITVQRAVLTPDGAGGNTRSWIDVMTARAFVKPISGSERMYAMRIEANTTHKIYMRYTAALLTSDRIIFKGRTLEVNAVINIEERDRWLEVHAVEGVAT